MWYDVLCVGILLFFTARGAIRGVIWQVAGIAGITLCFIFGNQISGIVGPYIRLDPPLNHWVALLIAYLGFSFVCFGLGRVFTGWMEKNQLKEFNRHLGAVFGLGKGIILCMVLTFLLVTVSEDMRARLQASYTGRYTAIIMDRLHPIMPEKLHEALADYIHRLDHDGLDLKHTHSGSESVNEILPSSPGGTSTLGTPSIFPQQSAPANPGSAIWNQLSSMFSAEAQQVVSAALQKTSDPTTRARIETDLNRLWNSVPPQDRAALQQQIVNAGSTQLQNYLSQKLQPTGTSAVPAPIPVTTPSQPAAPVSAAPSSEQRQLALIREIASRYSSISNVQQGIEQQITQQLTGLPEGLTIAVLEDWSADVWSRQPDPDPQTGSQTAVEYRILRQLPAWGLTIDRLPPAIQQRLRAAQSPQAGNPL